MADAADKISLAGFRSSTLRVETKPDNTPVTEADQAVERELRSMLAAARPADGIMGEEYGEQPAAEGSRRWVIDPIDGTKQFLRGIPSWATLIALETNDADGTHTRVGVVSAPALGMRWWGSRGAGAFKTDPASPTPFKLSVSAVRSLSDAVLSYSRVRDWAVRGDKEAAFLELYDAVWRSRAYGDFWSHMLVAEGAVDLGAEPELSRWDMAALQVIVEEAGGTFTDLEGNRGSSGGSLLSSNGVLHETALALLQG